MELREKEKSNLRHRETEPEPPELLFQVRNKKMNSENNLLILAKQSFISFIYRASDFTGPVSGPNQSM